MSSIRAVVVDPDVRGRLAIKEIEAPQPSSSEVLVRVEAISLNRGEVNIAMGAEAAGDLATIWPEPSSSRLLMARGQKLGAASSVCLSVRVRGPSRLRFLRACSPRYPPASPLLRRQPYLSLDSLRCVHWRKEDLS
jgi:hypothetical protein